jgi:N-[(2S)-2-amino-2-carboxyethyl]-L-glutamate dehydrogenase
VKDEDLVVLGASEVAALLAGQEETILDVVEAAYRTHGRGQSIVPHSCFLHLPEGRERMIALPAYLGGDFEIAGMKWIASFPRNVARGLARASGLVVLNALATGRPCAVLEGAVVSAERTAASAALAGRLLHGATPPVTIGVLGAGAINLATLRYLRQVWPSIEHVLVYDLDPTRAVGFAALGRAALQGIRFELVSRWCALVENAALLSIATTAAAPYIDDLGDEAPTTVLHLSLRDLDPALVLNADNVVDDADHVCRAETSLHLAERNAGHRGFIRCALVDVLAGTQPPKRAYGTPTIFSPFGLGILDIAVAKLVCDRAAAQGVGTRIAFAAAAR